MSIYAYIGLIIVFAIVSVCATIIKEKGNTIISIVLLIVAFIGLLFVNYDINNTPTALDVYKGNTELRIIYEGKVPVDSVVIFKKKVHETE